MLQRQPGAVRPATLILAAIATLGVILQAQPSSHVVLHTFQPFTSPAFPEYLTTLADGSVVVTSPAGSGVTLGVAPRAASIARVSPDGSTTILAYEQATHPLVEAPGGDYVGVSVLGGEFGRGRAFRVSVTGGASTIHDYTGGADGQFPKSIVRGPDGTIYISTSTNEVASYPVLTIAPNGTVTPAAFTVPGTILGVESDGSVVGLATCCFVNRQSRVYRRSPEGLVSTIAAFGVEVELWASDLIATSTGAIVGFLGIGPLGGQCHFFRIAGSQLTFIHSQDGFCSADKRRMREVGTTGDTYLMTGEQVWRVAADGKVSPLVLPLPTSAAIIDAAPFADGRVALIRAGGAYGGGELIVVSASGAAAATVQAFSPGNSDGSYPSGPVVLHDDGNLYGTTRAGGLYDCGVVYRLSRTGAFQLLHTFTGSDGCDPQGLVRTRDGRMFGTTSGSTLSSPTSGGTLFRVGTNGSLTTVFVFRETRDGFRPGPLSLGPDGNLYGRTASGGPNPEGSRVGTIFRLSPNGSVSTVHAFSRDDNPSGDSNGRLVNGSDGFLYGTTQACGSYYTSYGNLFKVSTSGGFNRLVSFAPCSDMPYPELVEGNDARIYGSTTRAPFAVTTSGALSRFADVPPGAKLLTHGPDGRFYGSLVSRGVFTLTSGGYVVVDAVPSLRGEVVGLLVDGGDGFLYGGTRPSASTDHPQVGFLFKFTVPPPRPPTNIRIVR